MLSLLAKRKLTVKSVKYILRSKDASVIPDVVTSDSLLKVDDNLMATTPIPSDANVLVEYQNPLNDEGNNTRVNDFQSDDEGLPCPKRRGICNLASSTKFVPQGEEMQKIVSKLHSLVHENNLEMNKGSLNF